MRDDSERLRDILAAKRDLPDLKRNVEATLFESEI